MHAYKFLCVGLAVAVIVLLIGFAAAYLKIPEAYAIIGTALGAITLLMIAIGKKIAPKPRQRQNNNLSARTGE